MLTNYYLDEIDLLVEIIEDLIKQIKYDEETIDLDMEEIRNRVVKFELSLGISSLVFAFGAMATGLFGMNLMNHLEFHHGVFYIIAVVVIAMMYTIFQSLSKVAHREQLL